MRIVHSALDGVCGFGKTGASTGSDFDIMPFFDFENEVLVLNLNVGPDREF